jgi:predicted metal-dependent phosphoesterase TrpH
MDTEVVVADLHMHTPASDGTIGAERRAAIAADRGLDAIAITDHDSISERLTDRQETIDGVDVITGIEVRADLLDTKIEILGYFVDPADEALQEMLARARGFREQRNRALVENLSSLTDLDLSYEDLSEEVDGNLGRPHLARRLVDSGVVSSIGEAFDEHLARDGQAFVPMERLDYEDVIETIHGAGGITSLAHPGRIRADAETVEEMVGLLADAGLDAVEVWYPYGAESSPEYADVTVSDAASLAETFDLLKTGGSDCHGPDSGKFRLGERGVSAEILQLLSQRATQRQRGD